MAPSLGIIIEQLSHYGGSEIYLLECIRRWQDELDICIYSTKFNKRLLKEFRVDLDKVTLRVLPQLRNRKHRFRLLDDLVVRPRIWEEYIGSHDLYFQYLFPTQMVRKSPSIWFAAEPLRMLYDLRHHQFQAEQEIAFHVYPRMQYDTASGLDLNVMLQVIHELDRNSHIETLATNSRMMSGYLETIYGRGADVVAHPGINLPADPPGPADNQTALFVGRLWDHKRVDLVIEALSLLPHGRLTIVGEGPERPKLERLADKLGVRDRVDFAGRLSNRALDRMYRSVTCGIYTPTREPFGIMPLEASSYGLPVVVTEDGGYTEALDASCAHVVPPEPRYIADALDRIFSDRATTRRMGEAGRRRVENFTWDHTAARLLELFREKLAPTPELRIAGERPLLGAHYYPWYESGDAVRHWNENPEFGTVTDMPVDGPYTSADRDLILRHLELAQDAGLDYLVVNLQVGGEGLDELEVVATLRLFDIAEAEYPDLSLCVMLTPEHASSNAIRKAQDYVEEEFMKRGNYLNLRSRPVLWYFITDSFIGHFFHEFGSMQESTKGIHCIAASGFAYSKNLPEQYAEFFDGWTLYSPLQISDPNTWERAWSRSYQDFDEDNAGAGLRAFTVSPGFDDTGLTHRYRSHSSIRSVAREDGEIYRKMQQACLALERRPDLVVITSFNEFHENTHIEPTEANGDKYISATRAFSEEIRSLPAASAPTRVALARS